MNKNAYWRKREEEQLKHYIRDDAEIQRIMSERYSYMLRQIEVQINDFYARYARAEKITLAEAQQRIAKMDVQAFAAKAKKYVKEKDFSPQANKELRLYNATMRINRLELLKANIGLEMVDGFNDIEKTLEQGLSKRTSDELKRQEQILRTEAGILNTTVFNNAKTVQSIVNASFQNATWSTRIWGNQSQLRDSLSALLTNGLIQGKNPLQLAPALRDLFGASRKAAERLMITEMARVQTDAQMESFKRNDIDEYVFISVDTACSECMALNGQHFRVSEMAPGENAPPIHPRCRCSTAAYVDREALERELFKQPDREEPNSDKSPLKGLQEGYYTHSVFRHAKFKTGGLSPEEYALSKVNKKIDKYDKDGIIKLSKEEFERSSFDSIRHLTGKLNVHDVRLWYDYHVERIQTLLDPNESLEKQARKASALRNQYRDEGRLLMADVQAVQALNKEKKNLSFEDLVEKARKNGLEGDDIYRDILRSSIHHSEEYDRKAGV